MHNSTQLRAGLVNIHKVKIGCQSDSATSHDSNRLGMKRFLRPFVQVDGVLAVPTGRIDTVL